MFTQISDSELTEIAAQVTQPAVILFLLDFLESCPNLFSSQVNQVSGGVSVSSSVALSLLGFLSISSCTASPKLRPVHPQEEKTARSYLSSSLSVPGDTGSSLRGKPKILGSYPAWFPSSKH